MRATAAALTIEVHHSPHSLPVNCVIVSGPTEMILVDTCLLLSDARVLVERLRASGKRLRRVLLTHAHPDHYFGMDVVREAFGGVEVYARPRVQESLVAWPATVRHWAEVLGVYDVPWSLRMPRVLADGPLDLEGHELVPIDLFGTESLYATAFYIPSRRTLLAGDLVCNGRHPLTADVGNLPTWISQLQRVRDAYDIETVIMGHGEPAGPEILDVAIEYLRTKDACSGPGIRVADVARRMKKAHPELSGEWALWTTCSCEGPRGGP